MDKRDFIVDVSLDGTLADFTKKAISELIAKMAGKKLKITIAVYKRKRSNPQNAFYFGVIVPLVRQMFLDAGNDITSDEAHYFIKKEVWRHVKTIVLPDGKTKEVVDTSTKLTTAEWENFMEKTRAWAAEFDLMLPFPNE